MSEIDSIPKSSAAYWRAGFVLLHVVPLLLAATAFTVVTAPAGPSEFRWSYFDYAHANGWGYAYRSDYSLTQVCTYLLAYGSGVVLHPLLTRPRPLAALATVACLAGFGSFSLELSHWLFDHHLSLVASFPIIVLPVAIWTAIALSRKPRTVAPSVA